MFSKFRLALKEVDISIFTNLVKKPIRVSKYNFLKVKNITHRNIK